MERNPHVAHAHNGYGIRARLRGCASRRPIAASGQRPGRMPRGGMRTMSVQPCGGTTRINSPGQRVKAEGGRGGPSKASGPGMESGMVDVRHLQNNAKSCPIVWRSVQGSNKDHKAIRNVVRWAHQHRCQDSDAWPEPELKSARCGPRASNHRFSRAARAHRATSRRPSVAEPQPCPKPNPDISSKSRHCACRMHLFETGLGSPESTCAPTSEPEARSLA